MTRYVIGSCHLQPTKTLRCGHATFAVWCLLTAQLQVMLRERIAKLEAQAAQAAQAAQDAQAAQAAQAAAKAKEAQSVRCTQPSAHRVQRQGDDCMVICAPTHPTPLPKMAAGAPTPFVIQACHRPMMIPAADCRPAGPFGCGVPPHRGRGPKSQG